MFRDADMGKLKEAATLREVGNDFEYEFDKGHLFTVLFHEPDFGQYAVLDYTFDAQDRVVYWVDDENLEPINEGEGE